MTTHRDRQWIAASTTACVILVYIFPLLLQTPLVDPDEGLHAVIAQEMVESGDYVTPRLQGEFFRDKPILYFAAQAISLRMFGMHEAAVRLPGYLFALLGVATTWLLAHRLFGATVGRCSLLIALTSIVPMAIAQAGIHDLALVPWTNLMLLCLWELDQRTFSYRPLMAAIVLCALAILTKGMIGIAIVGVAYGSFVLLRRERILSRSLTLVGIVVVGMALASPWFIVMESSNPGYLRYYFFDRHVLGFATDTQSHGREPWFYYLPVLLGGTFPWSVYAAIGLTRRGDEPPSSTATRCPVLFARCWLFGGLLFLSAAGSKLVTYALPVFPAIAILAGLEWDRYMSKQLSPSRRRLFADVLTWAGYLGILLPVAAVMFVATSGFLFVPATAWIAALVLAFLSARMLSAFRHERPGKAIGLGAVWMALFLASVMTWPGQIIAEQHSARSLGCWLKTHDDLPADLVLADGRAESAIFYLSPAQRRRLKQDHIHRTREAVAQIPSQPPADARAAIPDQGFATECIPSGFAHDAATIVAGRYRVLQRITDVSCTNQQDDEVIIR